MVAAVSIQELHKYYHPLQALAGIHFEIPNGAGKSTLINQNINFLNKLKIRFELRNS